MVVRLPFFYFSGKKTGKKKRETKGKKWEKLRKKREHLWFTQKNGKQINGNSQEILQKNGKKMAKITKNGKKTGNFEINRKKRQNKKRENLRKLKKTAKFPVFFGVDFSTKKNGNLTTIGMT